jgi:hypothetical protein
MALAPTSPARNGARRRQSQENVPKLFKSTPTSMQSGENPLKKSPRRSSKPIINWLQRKLAGTVKSRRPLEDTPLQPVRNDNARRASERSGTLVASQPLPGPQRSSVSALQQQSNSDAAKRKIISLNGGNARDIASDDNDQSIDGSSLAPESTMEADEDASVRPFPPSAPPSPSPSYSSSSYLSDPRTFGSIAASTKPTTLLSVDLAPNGVAHIAQVPTTPVSQVAWFPPHVRTASSSTNPVIGSGASVTFSALPPSPQSMRTSGSINQHSPISPQADSRNPGTISTVQAPLHTTHHPRNNPRPSSPPLDNASILTLASSAFAFSGSRVVAPGWGSSSPSATGGGDSLSHFGGSVNGMGYADAESTSQFVMGDDERTDERDASLRALRPRSSRRGSWDSETSDWSARLQSTGTPSFAMERSLRTSNSIGGHPSVEGVDKQAEGPIANEGMSSSEAQTIGGSSDADSRAEAMPAQEDAASYETSNSPPPITHRQGAQSTDTVAFKDGSPVIEELPERENLLSPDQDAWLSAPSTPLDS